MPRSKLTQRAPNVTKATKLPDTALAEGIAKRLETLEAALSERLSKLEQSTSTVKSQASRATASNAHADRFWVLEGLKDRHARDDVGNGSVLYAGVVTLPSGATYLWQQQQRTDALVQRDWSESHDVLAALAHPMRLSILRACLDQTRSTQDLLALDDMGTSGQLFHHLKALQSTGWLRSLQRGTYQVPGERVVPLLAILSACIG
jgi:hypothetical protein